MPLLVFTCADSPRTCVTQTRPATTLASGQAPCSASRDQYADHRAQYAIAPAVTKTNDSLRSVRAQHCLRSRRSLGGGATTSAARPFIIAPSLQDGTANAIQQYITAPLRKRLRRMFFNKVSAGVALLPPDEGACGRSSPIMRPQCAEPLIAMIRPVQPRGRPRWSAHPAPITRRTPTGRRVQAEQRHRAQPEPSATCPGLTRSISEPRAGPIFSAQHASYAIPASARK